jgi:membrane protein YdbS with pleckstrin-like domain
MGKPVIKYTKTTLIKGEKIIYAARIHWFAYFFPVATVMVGIILLLIPTLYEMYEEREKRLAAEQYERNRAIYIENQRRAKQGLQLLKYENTKAEAKGPKFAEDAGFHQRIWDNTRFWFSSLIAKMPPEILSWLKEANKWRQRIFGIIFIALGMISVINVLLRRVSTEMAITNKKIIMKKGFIQVDETEIPLGHIEGVKAFQTVMDRILNRGDVLVNGVGMEQIEIKKITDPNKFRNIAYSAVDKYGH